MNKARLIELEDISDRLEEINENLDDTIDRMRDSWNTLPPAILHSEVGDKMEEECKDAEEISKIVRKQWQLLNSLI